MLTGSSPEKRAAIAESILAALISNLALPEQDRYLVIQEYDDANFVHTDAFDAYGITYTDGLLMLEISFVTGRSDEVKKGLIADINRRLVEDAGVRSDDVFVTLYEVPPANVSFGQGIAQRAT
jgi:phenylpyruvate tautomerase PptA (4-oxalocrotonate tautomerase family)